MCASRTMVELDERTTWNEPFGVWTATDEPTGTAAWLPSSNRTLTALKTSVKRHGRKKFFFSFNKFFKLKKNG